MKKHCIVYEKQHPSFLIEIDEHLRKLTCSLSKVISVICRLIVEP